MARKSTEQSALIRAKRFQSTKRSLDIDFADKADQASHLQHAVLALTGRTGTGKKHQRLIRIISASCVKCRGTLSKALSRINLSGCKRPVAVLQRSDSSTAGSWVYRSSGLATDDQSLGHCEKMAPLLADVGLEALTRRSQIPRRTAFAISTTSDQAANGVASRPTSTACVRAS